MAKRANHKNRINQITHQCRLGLLVACLLLPSLNALGNKIDLKEAVPVNGLQQWIWVKGNESKPLLLFLHGGPGNSVMGHARQFTGDLENDFLIVHWDQRNSGETLLLNPSSVPLTVELTISDAVALSKYLLERFHQKKLILMGHSWGGFLALLTTHRAPELYEACVAMSPMVDQNRSEQLALEWMQQEAQRTGKPEALVELSSIRIPFETASDLYLHRKWLALLGKRKAAGQTFVEDWATRWLPLFKEGSAMNLFERIPSYEVPMYFFVGRKDYQTNAALTHQYYQKIMAPKKELIWFDRSAHSPNTTETKRFVHETIRLLAGTTSK